MSKQWITPAEHAKWWEDYCKQESKPAWLAVRQGEVDKADEGLCRWLDDEQPMPRGTGTGHHGEGTEGIDDGWELLEEELLPPEESEWGPLLVERTLGESVEGSGRRKGDQCNSKQRIRSMANEVKFVEAKAFAGNVPG